jgi:autotransporter-associated beta strand protein
VPSPAAPAHLPARRRTTRGAALLLAALAALAPAAAVRAAGYTWIGSVSDNLWSTPSNWGPAPGPNPLQPNDTVIFNDAAIRSDPFVTTSLTSVYRLRGIVFQGDSPAITIGGNVDLGLGLDGINQVTDNGQTIALGGGNSVVLLTAQTWSLNGQLNVNAPINAQGNTLTKAGPGTLNLGGSLVHNLGPVNIDNGGLVLGAGASANVAGDLRVGSSSGLTVGNVRVLGGALNATAIIDVQGGAFELQDATGGGYALTVGGGDVGENGLRFVDAPGQQGTGGSIRKVGPGQLDLGGGSHSFSGRLTIDGGTVRVVNGGRLSGDGLAVTVASGATLQIDPNDENDWFLDGTLSGTGTLLKTGGSRFTLDGGASAFAGDVVIDSGEIQILDPNALINASRVTVNNAGGLVVFAPDTTINNLTGTGSDGSVSLGGEVPLGIVALNTIDTRYEGGIFGSGGLTKTGAGTLTLAGSASYSGETRVEMGRLTVEGTLQSGDVTVGNSLTFLGGGVDAELGGKGTVEAAVTCLRGGFVSPGDSPGSFTIDGDLTVNAEGGLIIEIGGTQQGVTYDLLTVTGSVTLLSGNILDLRFIDGFVPAEGDTFDFLKSGTGFTGFFDTVLINGRPASETDYDLSIVTGGGTPTFRLSNVTGVAVPEAGTLALFLPGVGPAGLWLLLRLRRRGRRGGEDA